MIYFTSDWHFCHDKPFVYEPRGFNNINDMNKTIIKKYNSIIKPEDDVYCLGDCMLMNDENGLKCIQSLKGKIHIIRGNHCTDNRLKLYKKCHNVVEVCDIKFLKVDKKSFYLSHFPTLTGNFDDIKRFPLINLCGHRHTKDKFIDMETGNIIYHVEVDAHDLYPVSIEKVLEDINMYIKKEYKQ